jgi:hypothetical protein
MFEQALLLLVPRLNGKMIVYGGILMMKWEYLSLTANISSDGNWHPRYTNSKEIQNWDKQPITDYLNGLGELGWELITERLDSNDFIERWEYTYLWADMQWKQLKLSDGRDYKGISGYSEFMDGMGKSGWELVTTTTEPAGNAGRWLMLFKRPTVTKALRFRFKRPKA